MKHITLSCLALIALGCGEGADSSEPVEEAHQAMDEHFVGTLAIGEDAHFGPLQMEAGQMLTVSLAGTGAPTLFVRFGRAPQLDKYDCRASLSGAASCSLAAPADGSPAYLMVHAYRDSSFDLAARFTKHETTGAHLALLRFLPDAAADQRGAGVSGGRLRIEYEPARMTACRGPGWSIRGAVRFWPEGRVQEFELASAIGATPFEVAVTPGSHWVELWFSNTDTWGCSVWDSNFGRNHGFEVLPTAPKPVHWAGHWGQRFTSGCVREASVEEPLLLDGDKRELPCQTIDAEVYVPDLTEWSEKPQHVAAQAVYWLDGGDIQTSWLGYVGKAGNNYRFRWDLPATVRDTLWIRGAFRFRFSTDGVRWHEIGLENGSWRTLRRGAGWMQWKPGAWDDLLQQRDTALVAALHARLASHYSLGYSEAKHAMYSTKGIDVEAGTVECIYTGERIDWRLLDQPGGFNVEHSWPQSEGAKEEVPKSDMHHLFPAEIIVNQKRGNCPFGETACTSNCKVDQAGSKMGTRIGGSELVFQVRPEGRGNIARAHFYFSVRYGLPIDPIEEAVLRRWSQEDPPDERERARSAAIASFQGKGNPFVERPELVELIADF